MPEEETGRVARTKVDASADFSTQLTVSVVVPVYNEAATVERLLRSVAEVPVSMEIIVVDDGSTDGTRKLLPRLRDQGLIGQLLFHDRNRGKGAALRTAFAHATGDVVVVQDADLEYDPGAIPLLLAPIAAGAAEAVYGSRFLAPRPPGGKRFSWHRFGNRTLTSLSNCLTGFRLTDMETCQKMIRTDLLQSLPLTVDRFGIEPEITARLAQARARILELPIPYRGRSYAEGKKIGWKDGVAAIWFIARSSLLPPRARPWKGRNPRNAHPPARGRTRP